MKQLVLSITAATLLALETSAAQPVVKAIVPEKGAAGFGQLVTIQGFGLDLSSNPVLTFLPALGGAAIQCSFNIPSASNTNELYIRLAINGQCSLPVGSYIMNLQTSQGSSNPYAFDVTLNPATPIVKSIFGATGTPITQAKVGDSIVVYGYGIDATSAKVILSQGATTFTVNGAGTIGTNGIGARVNIPAGLSPGTVLVQLGTNVGPLGNSPSNALKLTIVP